MRPTPTAAGPALALTLLVVLAGCTGLPGLPGGLVDDEPTDLGRESGYSATDSLAVTTDDGLNESERDAVVKRTMARVELIRGLEFTEPVSVEVISRDQYRSRRSSSADGPTERSQWNDQVWEALFIVNESSSFRTAFDGVLGSAVLGYYSDGDIVIVSDDPTPTIDRATLSHELHHALQDQQLSLGGGARTQDEELASDGLVEGDANFVEARYEERCADDWECIPRPDRSGGGGGAFNQGIYLTIIQPYVSGPTFVAALQSRGGWGTVNDAYDDFPASTEQVIHPELYPDEVPVDVRVPDRSDRAWRRFDLDQETDTVGEASIYAMFTENGIIDRQGADRYNYDHPLSAGWGGDTLVPYYTGDPIEGEYGYVWRTVWDTEADAEEFHEGYLDLLAAQGAVARGDGVYRIESGPYADAFRVIRRGDTVTVVNAPSVGELAAVHERE